MNFKQETINGCQVLSIQDERIDAHNSAGLKAELLQRVEQGGEPIIVQLEQVRFIDSSGLGALLSGHKQAVAKSGRLILVNIQPPVLAMFEITRLNRVFEIYADLNEALATQA
ncbi:MAG: STAS domain-containing protein [Methylovulum sp.]|uniref:STAS domain-containing protein n=1 Tax=Methylovulum sp. TaxID=1916980 RepID=UPI00260E3754|nr:STAS domain-containing protein [Methylovulum sp.]MDD2724868.1 STAS domain-containing protein [Methylovulum sp.]MDD5125636.1 STAS domain-containing protein [Methylovulum sp.]